LPSASVSEVPVAQLPNEVLAYNDNVVSARL
jgi:hypothetical protein